MVEILRYGRLRNVKVRQAEILSKIVPSDFIYSYLKNPLELEKLEIW